MHHKFGARVHLERRAVPDSKTMDQPRLFEPKKETSAIDIERVVLSALGEFQARGKALAERELPLDRLRGALRRATDANGLGELNDEDAVAALSSLGAHVRRVPAFVAKHPFRVTVPTPLAAHALEFYKTQSESGNEFIEREEVEES